MARMIQCIKLGKEAEGLDFAPYPGETLWAGFQRSVESLARRSKTTHQRKPFEPHRSART